MAPNVKTSLRELDLSSVQIVSNSFLELMREEQWEEVESRLKESPELARRLDKVQVHAQKVQAYPLHYLCKKKNAPSSLIESFVETWSEAASTTDSAFRSLPIHIACTNDISISGIKALVKAYPEGLTTADEEGNLPIHYACSLSSEETVMYLIESSPESIKKLNKRNQTALHLACSRYDISERVVHTLLKMSHSACKTRDWQGRCPVHDACMWHAPPVIIDSLLEAYPDSARLFDMTGLTPYGICRKRIHLPTSDPTIKLIRSYRKRNGGVLRRGRDIAQFASENMNDVLSHHSNKPLHGRMGMEY